MTVRPRACLTLLVCAVSLLSASCVSSRRAARSHPAPTGIAAAARPESDLRQEREAWEERRRRTRSGVSWRAIEIENRRRNLEARAARLRAGAALPDVRWKERGSFDQTGRTHVTVVGSDGETLFVGTDRGGVFSGTPGGQHWTPRSDGLGIGAHSFVIVPGTPEVWLAADLYRQVYVSKDKGSTWSQAASLQGAYVRRILRDPGRPRTVYALAEGADFIDGAWVYGARLYRSDDGGLQFTSASFKPHEGHPDLWIDRVDGEALYLATHQGLWKSTDAGSTLSLAGAFPAGVEDIYLTGSEAGAPTFYAVVRRADRPRQHRQLIVSEDGGRTWQERGDVQDFWGPVTASINDPDLVFIGGVHAYRSANAGRTFAPINLWHEYYDHPETKLHADLPGIDCTIYRGKEVFFFDTDGGTFISEDGGKTVRNITRHGLGNGQYYGILTSRNDSELIAAGSQDQGYQVSSPGSGAVLKFDQLISGDYGSLTSSDGTHDMLYSAYPGFILLQKREDAGELESFDFPVPRPERRNGWIPPLAADPDNPNVVYYADKGIWRIQRQATGQATSRELPHDFAAGDPDEHVTAFAISPANRNRWFAGTLYGRIWWSQDGGQTWSRTESPLTSYVNDVLPSPTDPDVWYVAGNGYSGPAVVRTTDGGRTWEPWSSGLPQTLVEALAFDDPDRQELYAATQAGPFRYDRQTAAWISLLGTKAPLTSYTDVEGIPERGVVRFATYGRGIWDYSLTGGPCIAGDQTFCFQNGRFEVQVAWKDFSGGEGMGHVVPGSGADSGLFWFFQPPNWEMMVKVLDACGAYNRFWIFSAATTTVEYTLRVRDTQTGRTVEYKNPSGRASAAVTDTGSFPCSATAAAGLDGPPVILPEVASAPVARRSTAAAACENSATTLCLAERFRVEMDWRDSQNRTGPGQTVSLRSSDSGIFWFFSANNWETLAKIVNGCSYNGHYWVFGAALTNVEYTLRVTDTVTGRQVRYTNPLGVSSPAIVDTSALPCD